MTKARDLANLISTGNPLADGALAVAEVTGAAPLASPTFTGTLAAPTINASTALQIGGTAITVGASDINTVTAKAPLASPTFTGDVTLADKIVHTSDTNTAIRFPANDTVAFETGGSERFRFASAGQLGIAGANYGTSGQVLQSGGASGAASWADAGGGAYEAVSDAAYTSGSSAIDFTVEPDYFYTLEFMGVGITAGGAELEIAASHDAFSSTKDIQWWVSRHDIFSATEAHQRGSGSVYENAYGRLSYGNISGDTDDGSVHGLIHFAQKTGDYMTYFGTIFQHTNNDPNSNRPQSTRSCGRVMSTDSINRIRLKPNNANIKATRVRLLRRS